MRGVGGWGGPYSIAVDQMTLLDVPRRIVEHRWAQGPGVLNLPRVQGPRVLNLTRVQGPRVFNLTRVQG